MTPVAVVVAAGRGIGAACARELAGAGYRVVLLSASERGVALADELGGIGLRGDLTRTADLEALVARALEAHGRIDAVVNNTGHPARGPLLEIDDAAWHAGLDLLLLNVVRMARLVAPVMRIQGGGAFVNISSLAAREANPDYPVSSVVRAGLEAFTRLYAKAHSGQGIRMNNVLPGLVGAQQDGEPTPGGRVVTLEEVARTVAFLLSPAASGITGESVVMA